jgi:hypothetical protein
MALQYIDPFEGFTGGLKLGLDTIKGFRDEKRQDEDRAFNKQMAIEANDRAKAMQSLATAEGARSQGTYDYNVTQRPRQEKAADATLEGITLENDGRRIANTNAPILLADTLKTSASTRAGNAAQIRQGDARIALERQQQNRLDLEQEDTAAFRAFSQYVDRPNPALIQNNPRIASSILKLTGAAVGAPKLLDAVQNPFGAWRNNSDDRRTVLSYANINRSDAARRLGLDAGTTAAIDLRPSKGREGIAEVTFVGYDPKLKQIVQRTAPYHAEKLFDKSVVVGNTFNRIRNDPKARAAAVSGYAYSDPQQFQKTVKYEIDRRKSMVKGMQDGTYEATPNTPSVQVLMSEIQKLEQGDQAMTERAVFQRMGGIGAENNLNQMYLALDRVMDAKGFDEKQAVDYINKTLGLAMGNNAAFNELMTGAGINTSGVKGAGKDPAARASQILQALSRL